MKTANSLNYVSVTNLCLRIFVVWVKSLRNMNFRAGNKNNKCVFHMQGLNARGKVWRGISRRNFPQREMSNVGNYFIMPNFSPFQCKMAEIYSKDRLTDIVSYRGY